MVFDCALFAIGVVWWQQLARRASEDLSTFRATQEVTEKAAIGILWGFSVLWAFWMIGTLIGAIRGLLHVLA